MPSNPDHDPDRPADDRPPRSPGDPDLFGEHDHGLGPTLGQDLEDRDHAGANRRKPPPEDDAQG